MRFRSVLFLAIVCCSSSSFAEKADKRESDFIEFDGNKLFFSYEGRVPGTNFREYIPQNENLKTWTKLARVDHYSNVNDPMELARTLSQLTRKMNSEAPLRVRYNKEKRIAIVDFITWPHDLAYVEFNVFRIEKEGTNGLVSYNYAVREYKDPPGYIAKFAPIRDRLVLTMIDDGMKIQHVDSLSHAASNPTKQKAQFERH